MILSHTAHIVLFILRNRLRMRMCMCMGIRMSWLPRQSYLLLLFCCGLGLPTIDRYSARRCRLPRLSRSIRRRSGVFRCRRRTSVSGDEVKYWEQFFKHAVAFGECAAIGEGYPRA
jgi:hypothetical protein